MPVTEADVAITERLSSHTPFRAVLKQSVDDFIVNEIASDNTTVTLTRLPAYTPKRPRSPPARSASVSPPPSPPTRLSLAPIDLFFPNVQPPPSAALAPALAAEHVSHVLPVQPVKSDRRLVHEWIRKNLPAFTSDTVHTDAAPAAGQAVRIRRRAHGSARKRRRVEHPNSAQRSSDPSHGAHPEPDPREAAQRERSTFPNNALVNVVLWKRNRDTTEAISVLSKALHKHIKSFSYAGTKDRRAVTTQLVQIRGVQENQLARANLTLLRRDKNRPSVLVGNPVVVATGKSHTLRLGDLNGNRFTLVLRDFQPHSDDDVEKALHSIRQVGFINYFGLQRFGSGVSPTHVTGFALLRADFKQVCRRILLPLRIGTGAQQMRPQRQRFVQALEQFARNQISATQLLPQLAPFQRIERMVVESFAHDESRGLSVYDYRKAFGKLPRFLRMMYGHAVQSFLWNIMASERIRLCKPDPSAGTMHAIAGDLVLDEHAQDAQINFTTKFRPVTEQEEEKKSVPVHHVFIPVVGSHVPLPPAKYAQLARKILQDEKIDLTSQPKSEFALKGTYRRLLALPKDVETKISSYNDVQQLVASYHVAKLVAQLHARSRDSPATVAPRRMEPEEQEDDKDSVTKHEPMVEQAEVAGESDAKNGGKTQAMVEESEKDNKDGESDEKDERKDEVVVTNARKENECDKRHFIPNEQITDHSSTQVDGKHAMCGKERGSVEEKSGAPETTDQQQLKDVASEASGQRHVHGNDESTLPEPRRNAETNENNLANKASQQNLASLTKDVTCAIETGNADADEKAEASVTSADPNATLADSAPTKAEPTVAKQVVDCTLVGEGNKPTNEIPNTVKTGDTASRTVQDTTQMTHSKAKGEGRAISPTEETPNDQVESANGHTVLETTGDCGTEIGDGNGKLGVTENANGTKASSGNGETSRNEQSDAQSAKRALVISFTLGCAEYATMLVRELTGHESSTAAQKALQEGAQ